MNDNYCPVIDIPEEIIAAEKILSNWMVMDNVDAFGGVVKRNKHEKLSELYYELIMNISHKYGEETRHQTALRYIKQAESDGRCNTDAKRDWLPPRYDEGGYPV